MSERSTAAGMTGTAGNSNVSVYSRPCASTVDSGESGGRGSGVWLSLLPLSEEESSPPPPMKFWSKERPISSMPSKVATDMRSLGSEESKEWSGMSGSCLGYNVGSSWMSSGGSRSVGVFGDDSGDVE